MFTFIILIMQDTAFEELFLKLQGQQIVLCCLLAQHVNWLVIRILLRKTPTAPASYDQVMTLCNCQSCMATSFIFPLKHINTTHISVQFTDDDQNKSVHFQPLESPSEKVVSFTHLDHCAQFLNQLCLNAVCNKREVTFMGTFKWILSICHFLTVSVML